jgi:hypothetical protein
MTDVHREPRLDTIDDFLDWCRARGFVLMKEGGVQPMDEDDEAWWAFHFMEGTEP